MEKEEKVLPHELEAEELENVTGGFFPPPKGFVKCVIVDTDRSGPSALYRSYFCMRKCEYRGTQKCADCFHSPFISDAYLQQKYEAFVIEYNNTMYGH